MKLHADDSQSDSIYLSRLQVSFDLVPF